MNFKCVFSGKQLILTANEKQNGLALLRFCFFFNIGRLCLIYLFQGVCFRLKILLTPNCIEFKHPVVSSVVTIGFLLTLNRPRTMISQTLGNTFKGLIIFYIQENY